MTAQILDGRYVATQMQHTLKKTVADRIAKGIRAPALAVILVGNDPASMIYVHNKRKTCRHVGFTSYAHDLPEHISENALLTLIQQLNEDTQVDGILIQLPLPAHIDAYKIIEAIDPKKDVDGFHPYNLGRLAQKNPAIRACTPYGIIQLLDWYHLKVKGLHAVVVGASNIVGRPMALELLLVGATVTICHHATVALQQHVAQADILVIATGQINAVDAAWIKQEAIVVDVGMHRLPNGQLRGDIDFSVATQKAAWITPVPFGVGPMTVTTLLYNTLHCAEQY